MVAAARDLPIAGSLFTLLYFLESTSILKLVLSDSEGVRPAGEEWRCVYRREDREKRWEKRWEKKAVLVI